MTRLAAALLIAAASAFAPAAQAEDLAPPFTEASAMSEEIGEAYFGAYIARDWDTIEGLLGDDASFQDTTAELVFGGVRHEGRPAMMTLFREGYAGISRMEFDRKRAFYSGNYALFEGELDWTLELRPGIMVDARMPLTTILKIESGKVVEHRDYADYAPFLRAAEAALDAAGEN